MVEAVRLHPPQRNGRQSSAARDQCGAHRPKGCRSDVGPGGENRRDEDAVNAATPRHGAFGQGMHGHAAPAWTLAIMDPLLSGKARSSGPNQNELTTISKFADPRKQ